MNRRLLRLLTTLIAACAFFLSFASCGEKRSGSEIVEEIAETYGRFGAESNGKVDELLRELDRTDRKLAARWRETMEFWDGVSNDLVLNYDVLPDGLPEDDSLCIVALGFQLNADGSMREELVRRLEVMRASAEKYPNALLVCTGGGTASDNPAATEAGRMAEWLVDAGIDADRILVEDRSLTTVQNAQYSYDLLMRNRPRIESVAIVSSDYHISTGMLFFEAESIFRAEKPADRKLTVVANAACHAGTGNLSRAFQAGGLIELSREADTT